MYPDCGPVWHGQCSVCASPSHVPRLCSCLAWAVFSMCQPQSCTQTVVLSGMDSLQYVPALVMYPDCDPVWHGQCSVCASPSHKLYPDCDPVWHGQCSVCARRSHKLYPDCDPVWHGQCSICANSSQCMCWNRRQCPFLRQNMVLAVSRCRSRRWSGSLRLSGTGWVIVLASVKEMGCRCRCYIELLASLAKESNHRMNPATDYAGQGPLKTCFSSVQLSSVQDGICTL